MEENYIDRGSSYGLIGVIIAAVLTVAAVWNLPMVAILMPQIIALVPVALAFATQACGIIAGAIITGALSGVALFQFGPDAFAAVLILCAPAMIAQWLLLRWRVEFVRSLWIMLGVALASGAIATSIIQFARGPVEDLLPAYLRQRWDSLVSVETLRGGFTALSRAAQDRYQLLSLMAARGFLTTDLLLALNDSPTAATLTRAIDYITYTLKYYVHYTLIGEVVSGALLGAILCTAWPRMMLARHEGLPKDVEKRSWFLSLREWFLPHDLVYVICGSYMLTLMLLNVMPDWWNSVDYTLKSCGRILLSVQGCAALARMFHRAGIPHGRRWLLIGGAVLVGGNLLMIVGIASALFGSNGVVRALVKNMFGDDDPDD